MIDLSEKARSAYDKILNSEEIAIADLLESVGFIVNSSIKYDFDKIIRFSKKEGLDVFILEEFQRRYTPTGEEVMKGICDDAGKIIRQILYSLEMDDRFGITCVNANNQTKTSDTTTHDTTLIFDKQSGEWAVINSKSPVRSYNLVPKETLVELGHPYKALIR